MASLYEQLMAAKGAPQAAKAPNSTQLRKAPMNLRSAMSKYAEGGDVTNAAPDYSRANDAFGGAGGVYDLRNQFLNMGLDESAIGSLFSKYYTPETSQPTPQITTPSDPIPYSPGEGGRGIPTPYPTPEYARNIEKRRSEQEQENPRVSEDYYFKMRNLLNPPPEEPRYDPTPNPQYPEDPGFYQPPVYDNPMPVSPPEVFPQYPTDPGFYERPLDYYNPSPPMDFPTDPGFYQPPVDYYNPSPPMDFTQDPGFYQPPVDFSPTPKRSDDLKKLIEDIISNKGTGNLLENQRKLMSLLEVLKGK